MTSRSKEPGHPNGPTPGQLWERFSLSDEFTCLTGQELAADAPEAPAVFSQRPERWFFVPVKEDFESLPTDYPIAGFETEEACWEAFEVWAARQWKVCDHCGGSGRGGDWACSKCGGNRYEAWGESPWGVTLEQLHDEAADAWELWEESRLDR